MDLADKLTQLMARRGLSQEAFANALGVSHRTVGGWLSGSQPRPAVRQRMAEFFGVPLAVIGSSDTPLPSAMELAAHEDPAPYGAEFAAHLQRLRTAAEVGRELFPQDTGKAAVVLDAVFEALTRIETRLDRIEGAVVPPSSVTDRRRLASPEQRELRRAPEIDPAADHHRAANS